MADNFDARADLKEPLLPMGGSSVPKLARFKKERNRPSNRSVFKVTAEELELLFNKENMKEPNNKGECRETLNILAACGYNRGLCDALATEAGKGIIGDAPDLERRAEHFGKHRIAMPQIQAFSTILFQQFEEESAQFLTWGATLYLCFSAWSDDRHHNGPIESLTIYFGLMFASLLAALCDWIKEKQLLGLKDEINNQQVTVYRGAYGTAISVQVRDLVVGDIVQLSAGDRVPADCVIMESINLAVDESVYSKHRAARSVDKEASTLRTDEAGMLIGDNHKGNPDNILLSNAKIMRGEATALVGAVGAHTRLSRSRKKEQLVLKEADTELERKLAKVSASVGNLAKIAMALCFLTQAVYAFFFVLFSDRDLFSNYTALKVLRAGIVAICILIVSIPEGLPLAVSVAMALSITKMKSDKILIKNVESVQKCASLHDVCVGKTGTLTEGDLHVGSYQVLGEHQVHANDHAGDEPTGFNEVLELNPEMKDLLKEAIAMNTDARIEIGEDEDGTYRYLARGQATEVGMIDFLLENGEDVQERFVKRNRSCAKLLQFPFDQELKRKTVVRNTATSTEAVRVYVKGAPEELMPLCTATVDDAISAVPFEEDQRQRVLALIAEKIAGQGHKPLSYAYKDMPRDVLDELKARYAKPPRSKAKVSDEEDMKLDEADREREARFRHEFESDLHYLGTFGLADELRPEVGVPISLLKYGHTDGSPGEGGGQVNVRMISGDHLEACKRIAVRAGIVGPSEAEAEGAAITGEEFRRQLGGYEFQLDEQGLRDVAFEDGGAFGRLKKRVKIIARATPADKLLFVRGMQQAGALVGMAGDSIADAEVLKLADVGLCMGTGCDVAKDNSDLVILDNNFHSIRRSILWGRTMYENVRKFLQFQLTINASLVAIVFISGCTLGCVPFNAIQLLWMNLIMDILAAISLGTEPIAEKSEVPRENPERRVSRAAKIFHANMWRNIVVQGTYQIVVVLCLLYFGPLMFLEKPYDLITATRTKDGVPTERMKMDTMIFTAYFLMNMVNQINCRVVEAGKWNVFPTLFNNWIFWAVFIAEMGVTHLMLFLGRTEMGAKVLGVAELSTVQYIVCWACALLSLPLFILTQTKLPLGIFEKILAKMNLEDEDAWDGVRQLLESAHLPPPSSLSEAESPAPKGKDQDDYDEQEM